jgi:hypothetical protein
LSGVLIFCFSIGFGQIESYNYKRKLKETTETWNKIILPDDLFGKISPDLSDIRIIGINNNNDTIEAPYILELQTGQVISKEIQFKLINQSRNNKGYYFTFEIPGVKTINEIGLEFEEQNFDWKVTLNGSQNLHEWFIIKENYRILSIKNEIADYSFTTINIPESKYRYVQLIIHSEVKPTLIEAKLTEQEIIEGIYREYKIRSTRIQNDKYTRQTIIDIELPIVVPVSYLKIGVKDNVDFYRPVAIKYLTDSINTQKGWINNYASTAYGTLSSLEDNEFKLGNVFTNKLKIIIDNNYNKPLEPDYFIIKGNVYLLIARITEPAIYYLVYGDNNTTRPDYDIELFRSKIPTTIKEITLGNEERIIKKELPGISPLFQNKIWLWIILTVIILLLGWFSLKMIKKTNTL